MNDTSFIKKNFKIYLETVLNYLNHTNENYLNDTEDLFEIIKSFSNVTIYGLFLICSFNF
jgi:hypothetical protein